MVLLEVGVLELVVASMVRDGKRQPLDARGCRTEERRRAGVVDGVDVSLAARHRGVHADAALHDLSLAHTRV